MSKQAMREETERLVKEALERKTLTVKQGKTRIDSTVNARAEWYGRPLYRAAVF